MATGQLWGNPHARQPISAFTPSLEGETMTVRDIARTDIATIGSNVDAHGAARVMDEGDVGSVVVVEDDRPIGIVTDRDLMLRVVREGVNPDEATVEDVMTENPETVDADTGVYELFGHIADASVRRMPVVDGDELVGIVTVDDLVRLLSEELESLCAVIESESPPY